MVNARTFRRIHLYPGVLFAPVLLAFTASGAWQVYRFMAYRFTARPLTVTLCLLRGILFPAVFLLLGR